MINLKQKDKESRGEYLVRLAIVYIKDHSGIIGCDDDLFYDEAECDGFCLADDLMYEFDIDENDLS